MIEQGFRILLELVVYVIYILSIPCFSWNYVHHHLLAFRTLSCILNHYVTSLTPVKALQWFRYERYRQREIKHFDRLKIRIGGNLPVCWEQNMSIGYLNYRNQCVAVLHLPKYLLGVDDHFTNFESLLVHQFIKLYNEKYHIPCSLLSSNSLFFMLYSRRE